MSAILSSVLYGLFCIATMVFLYKKYLPCLVKKVADEETDLIQATSWIEQKKWKIVFATGMVLIASICGGVIGQTFSFSRVFQNLLILLVLSIITITDLRLYRIPNLCVLVILLGRIPDIIIEIVLSESDLLSGIISSLLACFVSFLFLIFVSKITRGGIGFGDVKLFSALGFLCGLRVVVYTLLFSFVICALLSVIMLMTKRKNVKDSLPLGPFVYFGFTILILLGLV